MKIRNAIRVFNESHRVHREPNLEHKALVLPRNGDAKPTYAYADNFGDQKEYFLASAFTHIHLQPQGDLSLYGVGMSVPFIRSALDKYGVIAHVFKHGKFKNAANSLTETGFTRAHRENTTAIVRSINQSICESIVQSRSLPDSFNQHMWQRIFKYGSLPAMNAKELGLVDYTPKIDPLDAILRANENEEAMKEAKEKWGKDIDVGSLKGTKTISLQDYKSKLVKHKKHDERKWLWHERLKFLAEKSSATTQLLSLFQYNAPHYNIDEVSRVTPHVDVVARSDCFEVRACLVLITPHLFPLVIFLGPKIGGIRREETQIREREDRCCACYWQYYESDGKEGH